MVDGEQGHANRDDTVDMVYLPTSFGFRPCYKRYMENLGYAVKSRSNGVVSVEGIGGKSINRKEFVSFTTYCRVWKKNYPQLKVSCPVEDICQYCFVFANRHRYLANQSAAMDLCVGCDEDGDDVDVVRHSVVEENGTPQSQSDDDAALVVGAAVVGAATTSPECDTTTVAEERELLLLECAMHIKMARAQRSLYQSKIDLAVAHAKDGVLHSNRTYTFVVDYGQNMELPVFNTQQPGCTYYYSPVSV